MDCVDATKDEHVIILLSHAAMAPCANVAVQEMPMPLWLLVTTSAQLLSTTGTAPSTPLSIPLMPLESCSLQEPARGIAMWVNSLLVSFKVYFYILVDSNKICCVLVLS